jgi:hypothetical protein
MPRRRGQIWSALLLLQAYGALAGCMSAEVLRNRAEQSAQDFCRQQGKKAYITDSRISEQVAYLSSHVQYVCIGPESSAYWHPGLEAVLVPSIDPAGARVRHFLPDSPARRAGLLEGDVIREVDGHAVSTPADVMRWTEGLTADTTVTIGFLRKWQSRLLQVPL